jgi:hydrogenase maturation protease
MENAKCKTLVLGIGNILLRDEGIGVRVVEALKTMPLPPDVELVDGGTAGADLIDVLAQRQNVIIVDAVQSDAPPGTILKLTPRDLLESRDTALSLHDLDVPQTLAMTRLLGCAPEQVIIIGIVPESIDPGMELTPALQALVPRIVRLVREQIQNL